MGNYTGNLFLRDSSFYPVSLTHAFYLKEGRNRKYHPNTNVAFKSCISQILLMIRLECGRSISGKVPIFVWRAREKHLGRKIKKNIILCFKLYCALLGVRWSFINDAIAVFLF